MKHFLTSLLILFCAPVAANENTLRLNMETAKPNYTQGDAVAINELLLSAGLLRDWPEIEAKLRSNFALLDPKGTGFRKIDQDKQQLVREAGVRARSLQKWLAYDLDGDGSVTDEELRAFASTPMNVRKGGSNFKIVPNEEQQEQILKQLKSTSRLPDPDGDGITTLTEMLDAANKQQQKRSRSRSTRYRISFDFDTNNDTVVTEAEYIAAMRATFKKFDTNNNETMDATELTELRSAQRATRVLLRR